MQWVERYKQNRWSIARVSGRAMHRFAIMFVIGFAADQKRGQFLTDHDSVVRKIFKVRRLWFTRAKELMRDGLWTPGSNITKASADLTARRCLFCRPSCVFYNGGNLKRLRPCQRTRFCPFCCARTAAFMYWNVRRYINTRRKLVDDEIVTCVVTRQLVTADDFSEHTGMVPGMLAANVRKLRAVVQQHCQAYEKKTKALQRHTDGSMWTVVVSPTRQGWRVESRQFLMGRAGAKLPLVIIPGASVSYMRSVKIDKTVATTKVLGRFARYPKQMLTGYLELTGVALQATAGIRLRRGTGRFKTTGRGLTNLYRRTIALERQKRQAGYAQKNPQSTEN